MNPSTRSRTGERPARSRAPAGTAGFTLVEVLVVATLLVLVFTALTIVFTGGQRMNRASQLTVAVHGALLVQEQISIDLKQMGVRPGNRGPVQVGPRSLAFYRATFDGPAIRLRPIRYSLEPTGAGNFHLVREEYAPDGVRRRVMRDVAIQAIEFKELVGGIGEGRFVVVRVAVLADDFPPEKVGGRTGTSRFSLMFLNKIQVPSLLGGSGLAQAVNLVVEGDLPPEV